MRDGRESEHVVMEEDRTMEGYQTRAERMKDEAGM